MNKIILLTLVVLSLLLATEARFNKDDQQTFLGFTPNQPLIKDVYQCLKSATNYTFQVITGRDINGINPQVYNQAKFAEEAGFETHLMYIPCINKDTDAHPECRVSDQVNKFLAATSDINHQIIWIKISANDDEKCKWTNDINFNCQRTQDIANYLKVASNKKIGYFSTQEDWIKIYGDKYGCSEASDLYNFYPLYYKYLDDQPNTKEFLSQIWNFWTSGHENVQDN